MRDFAGGIALLAVLFLGACSSMENMSRAAEKPGDVVALFNGKSLEGWDYYLVDPDARMADVWSIQDGVLVCKGEPMGYLFTKAKYRNFRLEVEWRWPAGVKPTNSGVLMRISGEHKRWPKCLEAQLKHESAGDVMGFHGFRVKGDAARSLSKEGDSVGQLTKIGRIKGNEAKPGEWNRYEITLEGGNISIVLNGQKVNEATDCDVLAGQIGLQSEGGEVQFRTVRLTPIP